MTASSIRNQKSVIKNPLWIMVAILLLAAAFRFLAIDSAPPGWRDDELIEFNMDRRIADGWRPLFISEAEGHEPVYHYLHAGTILLFGDNLIGYKWLPMACGLLTIALTYALARKMFGVKVALLAAALMAVSFWPVMYSRFGVRHIGVLPWILAALYLLYPARLKAHADTENTLKRVPPRSSGPTRFRFQPSSSLDGIWRGALAGLCLAAAIMTYFAGRAVPLILIGFLIYLAVFNRSILRQVWWRYLLTIGIAALIVLPMFVEIANTPGSEKRTEVVGGPLIELRQGNVQPAIDTTLGTLGMFTFAGDPEWLYNIANRPVFDWITGLFFYLGVIICFVRLKRVESGFALVWLIVGIAPAFVSIPAASFSHTVVALPVVYVLAALGVVELVDKVGSGQGNKKLALSTYLLVSLLVVGLGAWLTIRDYFGTWANEYIVRFQYHAPTREVAKWLDQHPKIAGVAIGTNPNELVVDPVALRLDLKRQDVAVTWYNPEMSMVLSHSGPAIVSSMQSPGQVVQSFLRVQGLPVNLDLDPHRNRGFEAYDFAVFVGGQSYHIPFGDSGPVLTHAYLQLSPAKPGQLVRWVTVWKVQNQGLPSRLKMFLHVLNDENKVIAGNDREDINFATLQPGDMFLQVSEMNLPAELAPGRYQVEVGWYNPVTGERLTRADGSDRYLLSPLEVAAP